MNQHSYTILIIIALIMFSIYRRVRRNIGWQQLNQGKMTFRIVLFVIVGLIFFAEGIFHPISLVSDIVGILLGSILAFYSVTLTNFEQREERLYYRPNIWIGAIVTFIFLARFLYRFYGIFSSGALNGLKQGQANSMQNLSALGNSWTSGLMLIMFAYYVIYYVILLKKQKHISKINVAD